MKKDSELNTIIERSESSIIFLRYSLIIIGSRLFFEYKCKRERNLQSFVNIDWYFTLFIQSILQQISDKAKSFKSQNGSLYFSDLFSSLKQEI